MAGIGTPSRVHNLSGQHPRVLRSVRDLQLHGVPPGGPVPGDGLARCDAGEATDTPSISLLLPPELGYGNGVCLQMQARDIAVRIFPAHHNCNLIVSVKGGGGSGYPGNEF